MTPMLDAAIGYASRNLCVFPCEKKIPLTGTGGFKNATLDAPTILKWWTENPSSQIGLPTGEVNHLVVLDIDGPEGEKALSKWTLPQTFEVETRPGRRQLWFRQPDGVKTRCSAGVLGKDLDVRGDGGYVVAPPSLHHLTGKPYRIVRDLPLAEMPAFLLDSPKNGNDHSNALDIIPAGQRHRALLALAASLRARGFSRSMVLYQLQITNQHCIPPKTDKELEAIADWVEKKPAGSVNGRPQETSAEVELESFRNVKAEAISWLWRDRLALGKLSLFVGEPGKGKSLATVDIAARMSRGVCFPDDAPCAPSDTLILSAEDGEADTIRPRLDAANADVSRVFRIKAVKVTLPSGETTESSFSLDRDIEKLEQAIAKIPAVRLLVVDPLSAYLGRADMWKDSEVRRVLTPLAELASRRRIAIIGIMHLKKGEASALLRVGGSVAFVALARTVWGFGEHPDEAGAYVMVPVKNNLAPLGDALAYRIDSTTSKTPFLAWQTGRVTISANDVLAADPRARDNGRSSSSEAKDWLAAVLHAGAMPVTGIQEQAEKDGLSWATIRRAKDRLPIRAYKMSIAGGWAWELEMSSRARGE